MTFSAIDLHAHTTCSDGTDTPRELMEAAARVGLTTVGITDHDTIAGWQEAAAQVSRVGVSLVRGMEMTTRYHDGDTAISVHMLAYLFDPDNLTLTQHRENMLGAREERAREIVRRLARDVPISWDDVVAAAGSEGVIGRPHIADALVARGVVADRNQAFDALLHPRHKYYVPTYAPDTLEAIGWINDAGGRAVVAHPLARSRGKVVPLSALDAMKEAGLFGVEIWHRDNPDERREELCAVARRLELFPFGASDYHGRGKPNRLGEHTTAPETLTALAHGAFLEVLTP
ncbi:PHP domain-containing protein [Trueperella bialowiezensis]|uniref:Error-prone DNA polymerase n=1 Tax=Trueperella bialowiezensis TaxID=312285 RepID=A0A448PGC7_9ACTO|nr:PHP domain-containing protein [Trueperella bialowiezensis]VEI13944.1 error-prone DNA polymerase [Trueperella bialowiezensis]